MNLQYSRTNVKHVSCHIFAYRLTFNINLMNISVVYFKSDHIFIWNYIIVTILWITSESFSFTKFQDTGGKKILICTSDLRVSLVFMSASRTRFLKYLCLCWPTYRHYEDRCNYLVDVLVCWRSQILLCVI